MKTTKIKVRPEAYNWLNNAANEINKVWNYCRWISAKAILDQHKFLTPFDLINLVSGTTKADPQIKIGQSSINNTAKEYGIRRKQFNKLKLKMRGRKSLGWIPVKPEQLACRKDDRFRFCGKQIRLFEKLPEGKLGEGCFTQDSLGDWYFCPTYKNTNITTNYRSSGSVGVDLGIKTVATASDGKVLESRFYRDTETRLSNLQRHNHRKQTKYLHRKIKRQREYSTHQFSNYLIKNYKEIYIGNVSFSFMKSGNKAKGAYDGAMGKLKTQLLYKGQQAGCWVQVVSEKYTTQTCSVCGSLTGPQGTKGLVIRNWQCSECGTEHDRDINAALNICHFGMKHHPPSAGTSQNQIKIIPSLTI